MKSTKLIAIVTGLALAMTAPFAGAAKGIKYTYAELLLGGFDADMYDGHGGGVNISYGATDLLFLKMGFARTVIDTPTISGIDTDKFHFGIGAHMELSDKVDALGSVSYIDQEYSSGIPREGDEGYQVDLGVRGKVSKKVELNGNVSFRHMNYTSVLGVSDDEETGFDIGTVIKMKKKFHFTGKVEYRDETEETGVYAGIRLVL